MKKLLVGFMVLFLLVIVAQEQNTSVNASQFEKSNIGFTYVDTSEDVYIPDLLNHEFGDLCPPGQFEIFHIGPIVLCGEFDAGAMVLWGGCGGWIAEYNPLNAYTC